MRVSATFGSLLEHPNGAWCGDSKERERENKNKNKGEVGKVRGVETSGKRLRIFFFGHKRYFAL